LLSQGRFHTLSFAAAHAEFDSILVGEVFRGVLRIVFGRVALAGHLTFLLFTECAVPG